MRMNRELKKNKHTTDGTRTCELRIEFFITSRSEKDILTSELIVVVDEY